MERTADRLYGKLTRSQIPGLDGIRAVSVSAVVLGHLPFRYSAAAQGVSAFFVLSGFLITTLMLREKQNTGSVSVRNFYIRRAIRLLPAFYAFWALYILLDLLFQHGHPWSEYFAAALYCLNYYVIVAHPPNVAMAHTWSLAVEEQFYLLWPWAFLFFSRSTKTLSRFLVVTIIAVWVYRFILYRTGAPPYRIEIGFDTRADQLAIGCLLAVILASAQARLTISRVSGYGLSLFGIAAAAMSLGLSWRFESAYTCPFGFGVDGIVAAVLITQAIACTDMLPWRLLETRPMKYLGRISYGVYLYHWIGDKAVITYLTKYGWPLEVVAAFALAIGAATVSYFAIERRVSRYKFRCKA
jgi:peptidoglycan/LPS O-acetylase OafA/YrhL